MRAVPVGARLDGERFLVAINLHNNEGVLPHQILQLIQVNFAESEAVWMSIAHKLALDGCLPAPPPIPSCTAACDGSAAASHAAPLHLSSNLLLICQPPWPAASHGLKLSISYACS